MSAAETVYRHRVPRPPPPQPVGPPPESASLWTKAKRLRVELLNARRAGWKKAPPAVRQARLTVCQQCGYYDPRGNLLLGECHAPGCGCTRLKLWIATARCPLKPPKWVAV